MTVPKARHARSLIVESVRKRSLRLATRSTSAMALSARKRPVSGHAPLDGVVEVAGLVPEHLVDGRPAALREGAVAVGVGVSAQRGADVRHAAQGGVVEDVRVERPLAFGEAQKAAVVHPLGHVHDEAVVVGVARDPHPDPRLEGGRGAREPVRVAGVLVDAPDELENPAERLGGAALAGVVAHLEAGGVVGGVARGLVVQGLEDGLDHVRGDGAGAEAGAEVAGPDVAPAEDVADHLATGQRQAVRPVGAPVVAELHVRLGEADGAVEVRVGRLEADAAVQVAVGPRRGALERAGREDGRDGDRVAEDERTARLDGQRHGRVGRRDSLSPLSWRAPRASTSRRRGRT